MCLVRPPGGALGMAHPLCLPTMQDDRSLCLGLFVRLPISQKSLIIFLRFLGKSAFELIRILLSPHFLNVAINGFQQSIGTEF